MEKCTRTSSNDRAWRASIRGGKVRVGESVGFEANESEQRSGDVLNGIAYDESSDKLYVTGKMWPTLFEIRLRDVTSDESLDEARRVCTPSASLPQYGYP